MVHEANNDFVHVAVRAFGPFASRVPMHMFGTYCEGIKDTLNLLKDITSEDNVFSRKFTQILSCKE